MNWLQPPREPPDDAAAVAEAENSTDEGPEMSTLNYWAHRLNPLHDPSPGYSASAGPEGQSGGREVVFVACNRVGTESGTFVGATEKEGHQDLHIILAGFRHDVCGIVGCSYHLVGPE
jgi:protein N-terminal amidase